MDLSKADLDLIDSRLEKVSYRKGDIILKVGEEVPYQYYVEDGCLRTFFQDKKGKGHTLQFAVNDWWISDYTAFINSRKAIMNIECIQDATVYRMTYQQLESIYRDVPQVESFFRRKLERAFASFQNRILSTMADSAQERYLLFLKAYPEVDRSVKNYHIASYLGIATETLSRIRKRLAKE
ncbi:Crp/Fnr family transcriptional regulator [Neolewinella agarilytica]|uniref:Crp/Fnr family transcriptional regulator n=1 Tax=Neolewinella agarilytica TaxID=478744 RepID=UPI001C31DF90|nr:Crp/Fnr family transcriptional regulator [Neolewinella agarilytica]